MEERDALSSLPSINRCACLQCFVPVFTLFNLQHDLRRGALPPKLLWNFLLTAPCAKTDTQNPQPHRIWLCFSGSPSCSYFVLRLEFNLPTKIARQSLLSCCDLQNSKLLAALFAIILGLFLFKAPRPLPQVRGKTFSPATVQRRPTQFSAHQA